MIGFARGGRRSSLPLGCGDYAIQFKLLNEQQRASIEHVWHAHQTGLIDDGHATAQRRLQLLID